MAVRIRLSRFGRLHRPFFRIVAIDGRCHREGKASEILGSYDPLKAEKTVEVDISRVEAWVNQGAQISDSLRALLKHGGYAVPKAKTTVAAKAPVKAEKKGPAGKKGEKQPWAAPSRRALQKHAATQKAARKVQAEADKAKADAAKAAAAPAAEAPAAEAPKA